MCLSSVSPSSTLSNSLFIFPPLITKTTSFWGLLYNPINPIFIICLSHLGLFSLTSVGNIKKREMKNPHQEQDSERIKKPTKRSREKTSINPVVITAWSLRHLGSIAAASFAVAASLV